MKRMFPPSNLEMSCSLKAQMQRMFLPLSAQTMIRPDDLVVTTDVDTFVMKSDIFDELKSEVNRGKISILQVDRKCLNKMVIKVLIDFPLIISVRQHPPTRQLLRRHGFHLNAALPLAVTAQSGKKL